MRRSDQRRAAVFALYQHAVTGRPLDDVFEPNDARLQRRIESTLTSYLSSLVAKGMTASPRPQDSFYVKCNAENNTPEVHDLGQVLAEVGIALADVLDECVGKTGVQENGPDVKAGRRCHLIGVADFGYGSALAVALLALTLAVSATSSIVRLISSSVSESSDDVASSQMISAGPSATARAIATR
jgi:hypothetical protein